FGIGLKNFRTECPEPAYGQTEDVDARCDMHPHNMYLEWLSETGVIGLGGFLWLIGLWIRHFIAGARYWRHEGAAVGLVVAVTTYLWPVAAAMSFFTNWRAAVFWLVLGWALAATGDKPSAPAPAHTTS
ncbi:MAG: O-antigen ligase family protein, partial [Alphaproteobacteria bacterium]